jgi:group I intron endonuclease
MSKRSTTESFIAKARKVHGDKYDYGQVEYIVSTKEVAIGCPEHAHFKQTPKVHLRGSGCPVCRKAGNAITISGITYSSHTAAARAYGIEPSRLKSRLKAGFAPSIAVNIVGKINFQTGQPTLFDGVLYGSTAAICEAYNLHPSTIVDRQKTGLSFYEAVTTKKVGSDDYRRCQIYTITRRGSKKLYVGISANWHVRLKQHFGKDAKEHAHKELYKDINDLGEEGFDCKHIASAQHREDATECEKQIIEQFKSAGYELYNMNEGGAPGGNKFHPNKAWYEENSDIAQCEYHVFQGRVMSGWRKRAAIITPLGDERTKTNPDKMIRIHGKAFRDQAQIAQHYGFHRSLFSNRLKKGMTQQEAVDDILKRTENIHGGQLEVDGVTYDSRTAAARAFKMKPDTLYARLEKGIVPEVAVKLPSRTAATLMRRIAAGATVEDQYGYLEEVLSKK